MEKYIKKKKNMNFQSVESLQQVVNVVRKVPFQKSFQEHWELELAVLVLLRLYMVLER